MQDILETARKNTEKAYELIRESGVIEAWEAVGAKVCPVGSLPMGLFMKHRDVDFHIYTDKIDISESFKVISGLCADPAVQKMVYGNLLDTEEDCLEFHLWRRREDGEVWQIDMIQIRKGSRYEGFFEHVAERIRSILTTELRRIILELKNQTTEDDPTPGIQYYQAVLRDGVQTWDEFVVWRKAHPLTGVCDWCP